MLLNYNIKLKKYYKKCYNIRNSGGICYENRDRRISR